MQSYNPCIICGDLIDIAEYGMVERCAGCVFHGLEFTRKRWTRTRKRYNKWRRSLSPIGRIAYRCWSRVEPTLHAFEAKEWGRR